MSENAKEKNSSKTIIIILIIIIVLLIAGGAVAALIFLNKENNDAVTGEASETAETAATIGYEGVGVVALGEDEFQKTMEEMIEQAENGLLDLRYKNVAYSADGVNFECFIGNSENNIYDMYFNIYLDETLEDQILLTGLVPPGQMIENFESEIPLDPGNYKATLVFTQVKEDHATICGQVMVVLNLVVGNEQ